jgi:hypothetical protein
MVSFVPSKPLGFKYVKDCLFLNIDQHISQHFAPFWLFRRGFLWLL